MSAISVVVYNAPIQHADEIAFALSIVLKNYDLALAVSFKDRIEGRPEMLWAEVFCDNEEDETLAAREVVNVLLSYRSPLERLFSSTKRACRRSQEPTPYI